MPISVCLMEEKLPKLSDLSFCIFHISVLWLCYTWHEVLWPSSLFQSWTTLRHQLVAWHLIPGLVLPVAMDESLGRKGMGRAQQNPSEGLLSSKHCPTPSPWTSCHSLLLAPLLQTLQPLWTTLWLHCWFQQVSEIYFISNKIRVNLGYIWSIIF